MTPTYYLSPLLASSLPTRPNDSRPVPLADPPPPWSVGARLFKDHISRLRDPTSSLCTSVQLEGHPP